MTVVDTDTLAIDSIPVGPLPHHIEPANDGHTIYVSLASHPMTQPAPGKNEYAAIDTRDNSVTYRTSSNNADARSHAMTPTLEGDKLYVAHDTGNEVTAVDLETGAIDFTVPNIPGRRKSFPRGQPTCCGCPRGAATRSSASTSSAPSALKTPRRCPSAFNRSRSC